MKKQNIINLIKYHVENNNSAFLAEATGIAKDFYTSGDLTLAQYIMDLISNTNVYVPQSNYKNLHYMEKKEYSDKPLFLPDIIEDDIMGIVRAVNKQSGISKFLFYGAPGTGKTESAYQIARLLERDILTVHMEELIDSRLGETAKNVISLFNEINHLTYDRVVIIFDELDSLALNRTSPHDLREMGRVTSTFLKELDSLSNRVILIATTNLQDHLDKALLRRFDATVSFDRYSREDLIQIADQILISSLKSASHTKRDLRLFHKILNNLETIPYPGDLKQIIRSSVAFSDEHDEYDYLRKLLIKFSDNSTFPPIKELNQQGYSLRDIEILTKTPKSTVSRILKEGE